MHWFKKPSVKRVICDKKRKKICANILIPHERSLTIVLWQEEWLAGDPFYLKFWVKLIALEPKGRFSTDIRS